MKVGIIGAGYMSTFHAAAYNKLGVPIAAVVDVKKENYLNKKDNYGNAVFYDNIEDLLADNTIDIIDICVTNKYHLDIIIEAINADKHVFCEKTLTTSEADSAKILKLTEKHKKNFQIGYMKRFFPATQKAVELIPQIGEIYSAYIKSYQGFEWGDIDIYNSDSWKAKNGSPSDVFQYTGAGILNMAGSHMLDLMNLLLGLPKNIYCQNWSPKYYDIEMDSHSLFTMQNGANVHFEACVSPYSRGGLRQDGWDEKIEINGRKGRIEIFYVIWDKPLNNAPMVRFYSEESKNFTDFTFPKTDAFTEQIKVFIENCIAGKKSVPGIEEGYIVDKIIDACYRSSKINAVVPY